MESVTSYTYNVNNQLLSEVDGTMTKDYTYDNRGNLLKVSTGADILKEFTFDATNQMTASFDLVDGQRKKATYTYNGLGHRVDKRYLVSFQNTQGKENPLHHRHDTSVL